MQLTVKKKRGKIIDDGQKLSSERVVLRISVTVVGHPSVSIYNQNTPIRFHAQSPSSQRFPSRMRTILVLGFQSDKRLMLCEIMKIRKRTAADFTFLNTSVSSLQFYPFWGPTRVYPQLHCIYKSSTPLDSAPLLLLLQYGS